MLIETPSEEQIAQLLNETERMRWHTLTDAIEALYDTDRIWSKGFGSWVYEYKYRRGGKTLCTLYMKKDCANVLITLGKEERAKVEAIRQSLSAEMIALYDTTEVLHDGMWLWIPTSMPWEDIRSLLAVKRKPNRKQNG